VRPLASFGGQVGAVGDEEFDELIESVFGTTVQSGLVRDGIRARHLAAATEGQCDVRGVRGVLNYHLARIVRRPDYREGAIERLNGAV